MSFEDEDYDGPWEWDQEEECDPPKGAKDKDFEQDRDACDEDHPD